MTSEKKKPTIGEVLLVVFAASCGAGAFLAFVSALGDWFYVDIANYPRYVLRHKLLWTRLFMCVSFFAVAVASRNFKKDVNLVIDDVPGCLVSIIGLGFTMYFILFFSEYLIGL